MMTMTRLPLSLFMLALVLAPPSMLSAQSQNLEIYWIDVEGGAATLVVSPSGESTPKPALSLAKMPTSEEFRA
jgi:hypothetical protein